MRTHFLDVLAQDSVRILNSSTIVRSIVECSGLTCEYPLRSARHIAHVRPVSLLVGERKDKLKRRAATPNRVQAAASPSADGLTNKRLRRG